MCKFAVALVVTLFALANPVVAGDIEDEPFALRLLLSLERASNFAETLGLQAAAARPGGSSMNPAGDARRQGSGPDATVSNVTAFSSSGALIAALFGHASFTPGAGDRLSFAYAHTKTIDGDSRHEFENEFGSDEFYVRYSIALDDRTSFGAELRFVSADLQEESIAPALGFPARLDTYIAGPDLTLGVLTAMDEDVSLGFLAGFGMQWTKTDVENMIPLPIPQVPGAMVPAGTELDSFHSKVRFLDLRAGVAYRMDPAVTLLADIQYLHYHIEDLSKEDTTRLFAGARFEIADGLHFNVGSSLDDECEFTASAGVSFVPTENLTLSLSYQHNAFPEVHAEFGQFHQVTLSVSMEF